MQATSIRRRRCRALAFLMGPVWMLVVPGALGGTISASDLVMAPSPSAEAGVLGADFYFGIPPIGAVSLVAGSIDRGGAFSAPTDYPPQRHVVALPAFDTYAAFFEWNQVGDFMISGHYWRRRGGGGWSQDWSPSEPGTQLDAGRPSAHEADHGAMVAYHATTNGSVYDIWINEFDADIPGFIGSIKIADNQAFAFLDRSSEGTWLVVNKSGEGLIDIVVHRSTDNGLTWEDRIVESQVRETWVMPSGAADPNNGDLYVAYNHDLGSNGTGDVVIHRSTDGGNSWTDAQLVAEGFAGAQKVLPSLVVDRDHRVHLVYQENLSDTYDGGLTGLNAIGPAGPPTYARGHFEGNLWIEEERSPLFDRVELASLPDSCELSPTIENVATDTLSGMPQLSIYRGEEHDILYAACSQSFTAVAAAGGGWELCGPFQIFMQGRRVGDETDWSERKMVSAITEEQAEQGRNAIYPGATHEVPPAGPGYLWSEMNDATAPSEVLFSRPVYSGAALQAEFATDSPRVRPGELLPVQFKLLNPGANTHSFQVWVDGFDELGNPDPDNPLFGPVEIELDAAVGLSGSRAYLVPADTPVGGPYRLCLRVGQHPVQVIDEGCLQYEVIP